MLGPSLAWDAALLRLALPVLLTLACDSSRQGLPNTVVDASVAPAEDSGLTVPDAAVDAGEPPALDAGLASDKGVVAQPNPVFIGLVPNVVETPDAGQLVGNSALESELDALALGSRARWFRVSPTDLLGLSRIEQQQNVYRAGGVRVGLSIDCDEALRAPERTPGLTKTYQDLVSRVLKSPVPPLFITFGSSLDLVLADYEGEEREARVQWLRELMTQTRLQLTSGHSVGVGVSLAPGSGGLPAFELIEDSDVVAAAWLPLSLEGDALGPELALLQLASVTAKLAEQKKALVLTDVGYPASETVESSEEQQAQFYGLFFDWLAQNRERVPFVSIAALHEYSATDCAAWATEFQLPEHGALARCSIALRGRGGVEKRAFETVAHGLLRFFSP